MRLKTTHTHKHTQEGTHGKYSVNNTPKNLNIKATGNQHNG